MILISLLMGLWKRFAGRQDPIDTKRDGARDNYPSR
jgi:hypothetical protein